MICRMLSRHFAGLTLLAVMTLLPLAGRAQAEAKADVEFDASKISGTTEAIEVLRNAFDKVDALKSYKATSRQKMGEVMSASGPIWFRAPDRMRTEAVTTINMMGQTTRMVSVFVLDGTNMWIDTSTPMGRVVLKGTMEDLQKQGEIAGGSLGMMGNNTSANSVKDAMKEFAELENIRRLPDIEVSGQKCQVLQGDMKPSANTGLAQMAMMMGGKPKSMRIALDAANAFTHRIEILTDSGKVGMTMEFLDPDINAAIPDDTFDYEPPEGVPVQNYSDMMKMMGTQH